MPLKPEDFSDLDKFVSCPVAVPDIFVVDGATSSSVDRGHSLRSLDSATGGAPFAPPSGVPSLLAVGR